MIKGKSVIEGEIFVSTKEVGGCLSVCMYIKKKNLCKEIILLLLCNAIPGKVNDAQRLSCLCEKKSLKKNFKVILCPQLHCT